MAFENEIDLIEAENRITELQKQLAAAEARLNVLRILLKPTDLIKLPRDIRIPIIINLWPECAREDTESAITAAKENELCGTI